MDMYLPIDQAANILHMTLSQVEQLVKNGIIRSAMVNNMMILNQSDVRSQVALNTQPEYAEFAHMAGMPISLSEAFRKYGILQATSSRWVARGILHVVSRGSKELFVDEAEMAALAKIYRESGGARGRRIMEALNPKNFQ